MKAIIVRLAGKDYRVEPLTVRPSKAFRKRVGDALSGMTDLIADALRPTGAVGTPVEGPAEISASIKEIGRLLSERLIGSTDLAADLLFEYSPILAEDRERIENEAYDDEIIAAFVEVLKLLYPFESLASIFRNGRTDRRI